jgi:transposase-like protein
MQTEKKIYYSDLTTLVDVCYSCKSQNILHLTKGVIGGGYTQRSFCKDCNSEDVGAVFPDEVL